MDFTTGGMLVPPGQMLSSRCKAPPVLAVSIMVTAAMGTPRGAPLTSRVAVLGGTGVCSGAGGVEWEVGPVTNFIASS